MIGKPSPHPGKANLLGSGHSQPCPETLAGLALVYFSPHKAEAWSSSLDPGSVGNSWMSVQEVPHCWLHSSHVGRSFQAGLSLGGQIPLWQLCIVLEDSFVICSGQWVCESDPLVCESESPEGL